MMEASRLYQLPKKSFRILFKTMQRVLITGILNNGGGKVAGKLIEVGENNPRTVFSWLSYLVHPSLTNIKHIIIE
jgi:hypothetical protein